MGLKKKEKVLFAPLDVHKHHVVAIQETKIDSSIVNSEFFPETCPYNIFRRDKNLQGVGVMFLIHKDIPHMSLSELENEAESVWAKILANILIIWQAGIVNLVAQVKTSAKGNKLPAVHVLWDFNFKDIS